MVWSNNSPGSHIPAAVKRIIRLRQENECACYDASVCVGEIHDFDHVINLKALGIPRSDPRANDPALLQGLCKPCHARKSAREGGFARHGKVLRPFPLHPGLIR